MKIADVCMSLYERYCNPSANECLQTLITVTAKLCSRLIFANIHLGFKSINLLKGNNIQIPTRDPLMEIVRDINKVLSAMDSISRITGTDKIDHSSCLGYVKDTNKRVQMILDETTLDLAMCGWKKE